jgi:hypothetical protein
MGKCSLKIYNDNEELCAPDEITDKNDIITILEIQGIKCSARSFQIEIEIKQMLVLPNNNLFEKCILVKGKPKSDYTDASVKKLGPSLVSVENLPLAGYDLSSYENEHLGKTTETPEIIVDTSDISVSENILQNGISNEQEELYDAVQSRELAYYDKNTEESSTDLKEFELSLDEIPENEQIQIKTRNDVYYKMYQDAKKKAKLAKDLALSAYLEAKQIKNTYMLEDLDDSDSDLDEESFYEKQE